VFPIAARHVSELPGVQAQAAAGVTGGGAIAIMYPAHLRRGCAASTDGLG